MTAQKNSAPPKTAQQPISDETVLKIAKEIVVKFIEVGRVTPTNFRDSFTDIYTTIDTTVKNG